MPANKISNQKNFQNEFENEFENNFIIPNFENESWSNNDLYKVSNYIDLIEIYFDYRDDKIYWSEHIEFPMSEDDLYDDDSSEEESNVDLNMFTYAKYFTQISPQQYKCFDICCEIDRVIEEMLLKYGDSINDHLFANILTFLTKDSIAPLSHNNIKDYYHHCEWTFKRFLGLGEWDAFGLRQLQEFGINLEGENEDEFDDSEDEEKIYESIYTLLVNQTENLNLLNGLSTNFIELYWQSIYKLCKHLTGLYMYNYSNDYPTVERFCNALSGLVVTYWMKQCIGEENTPEDNYKLFYEQYNDEIVHYLYD